VTADIDDRGVFATLRPESVRVDRSYANGWWRAERTFLDDFLECSESAPDQVAVVAEAGPLGRHTLSYRQLRTMVDRFALGLLELGVAQGDVVSFQLPNWWQFPALAFACARIGAVSNAIPPILRAREVSFILEVLNSKVCIVPGVVRGHDYAAMVSDLIPTLDNDPVLFVLGAGPGGPRITS
jgi:cyclohexanecarboxylate-CoA ligase